MQISSSLGYMTKIYTQCLFHIYLLTFAIYNQTKCKYMPVEELQMYAKFAVVPVIMFMSVCQNVYEAIFSA